MSYLDVALTKSFIKENYTDGSLVENIKKDGGEELFKDLMMYYNFSSDDIKKYQAFIGNVEKDQIVQMQREYNDNMIQRFSKVHVSLLENGFDSLTAETLFTVMHAEALLAVFDVYMIDRKLFIDTVNGINDLIMYIIKEDTLKNKTKGGK